MKQFKNIIDIIKHSRNNNTIKQAILHGNYELFKELINNSYCDINKFDKQYKTLLDYATLKENIKIMSFLVSRKARIGTLFYLIQEESDFIKKVKLLHKAGYNFNNYDKLGFSPIHYASSLAFPKATRLLLNLNIKISSATIYGETALNLAIEKRKVGVYIGKA